MTSFNDILNFAPLTAAENITGKSYKDDSETSDLGLAFAVLHGENLRDELALRDDTYWNSPFDHTQHVFESLGFTEFLKRQFVSRDGVVETQSFYWRSGVLAVVDSYHGGTNKAKIYYNWAPNEDEGFFDYVASGSLNRDAYAGGNKVWVGDHDASTAIRHTLARLEDNGSFLESWIERPFLWCLNSNEERVSNGDDYKEVNAYVIDELFPAAIREAISPE